MSFLTEIEKLILIFICKFKGCWVEKAVVKKRAVLKVSQ
jgi:hypothetical protein